MLWYGTFKNYLEDMGFKLNPYVPCVAKKIINNKQYAIVWYVDNNKISHMQSSVVDDVIKEIEEKFGKMTVTRGNNMFSWE